MRKTEELSVSAVATWSPRRAETQLRTLKAAVPGETVALGLQRELNYFDRKSVEDRPGVKLGPVGGWRWHDETRRGSRWT